MAKRQYKLFKVQTKLFGIQIKLAFEFSNIQIPTALDVNCKCSVCYLK